LQTDAFRRYDISVGKYTRDTPGRRFPGGGFMKKIGIRANVKKVRKEQLQEIVDWLESNGIEAVVIENIEKELPAGLDMLLVMGGDGTLLGAARMASVNSVPLLGIDLGGLGFLSEVKYQNAHKALADVLKGKYQIEERMMLEAVVSKGGSSKNPLPAVNDVVITKNSGRLLRLKVYINDEYFMEFPGDGLIVSSATGSTAYSLSAGGPIVSPRLDVMLLTCICPHTLFARSMVTSGSDEILVELPPSRGDLVLSIDGQDEHVIEAAGEVIVRRAEKPVRYIRIKPSRFLDTVREKFRLH